MDKQFIAKKLEVTNFKGIKNYLLAEFKNQYIIYIIGDEGQGKTSLLDAMKFNLEGKKAFPQAVWKEIRSTAQGDKKTKVTLELAEINKTDPEILTITRSMTDAGVYEKISSNKKKKMDIDYINGFFNSFCFDPLAFSQLSGKDQALALGIDTGKWDMKYKTLFEKRAEINKEIKRLEVLIEDFSGPETSKVDLEALFTQKNDLKDFNSEQDNKLLWFTPAVFYQKINKYVKESNMSVQVDPEDKSDSPALLAIDNFNQMIEDTDFDTIKKTFLDFINAIDPPLPKKIKELEDVQEKIDSAAATNLLADEWTKHQENVTSLELEKDKRIKKIAEMDIITKERAEYLQGQNMGFSNVKIDEEGRLMFMERNTWKPLNLNFLNLSKIYVVIIRLICEMNLPLRMVLLKDAKAIGVKSKAQIDKYAKKYNLQIFYEIVGEKEQDGGQNIKIINGTILPEE